MPTDPREVRLSLSGAKRESKTCRRCELWRRGTQTVFGAGPAKARLMFVGEQPGDAEDLAGKPFVGPAGQLLRDAMEEAGIDPQTVYLTNAVKHFKWEARGKRRIHQKPDRAEVGACHIWLEAEVANVKPDVLVALGATATRALLGPSARVTRDRGKAFANPLAPIVTLTVHPSSILRAPDSESRAEARRLLVQDLRAIARMLR